MKLRYSALIAAAQSVAPTAYAADVVFGNFENGLDGFVPRSNATLSTQSAIGVTAGNSALQINQPSGGYWGVTTPNLFTVVGRDQFIAATRFAFDITYLSDQLGPGGGELFTGFAQANALAINDFRGNFVQTDFSSGRGTDSFNTAAGWGGVNGTRTLTWNIDAFSGTQVGSAQGVPYVTGTNYKQYLIDNPAITGVTIWINTQFGGGNSGASANFFIDLFRLTIPDPTVKGDFGGNESSNGSFNTPDNAFNELDVEGFLLALNDQSAYLALNPTLGPSLLTRGDFGGNESTDGSFNTPDGAFNELDVEGFLLALNDPAGYAAIQPPGLGGVSAIPEPAAIGLLAPLGLLISRRRR